MKVIDLLNKIANGEEVPKYVKYINHTSLDIEDTMMVCKENIFYKLDNLEIELNDEVEIIEEHKIPEKLSEYADISADIITKWSGNEEKLKNKINEIIDYLEENK